MYICTYIGHYEYEYYFFYYKKKEINQIYLK